MDVGPTPFYPIAGYSARHVRTHPRRRRRAADRARRAGGGAGRDHRPAREAVLRDRRHREANPQSEGIRSRRTGFTPNSIVDLAIDGAPVPDGAGLQTDAQRRHRRAQPARSCRRRSSGAGQRDFTVTLTEQGNPANVRPPSRGHTALGVNVKPQRAKPSGEGPLHGRGFTQDKPVYAHYVFGGKLKKTVRMSGDPGSAAWWRSARSRSPSTTRGPASGPSSSTS